mmetsp:Transcript_849/g.2505  ORF Transcript_849/g.2505 Transcript_849/m.2505 type:complete len:286 (+) Transcript_849:107-964(+)
MQAPLVILPRTERERIEAVAEAWRARLQRVSANRESVPDDYLAFALGPEVAAGLAADDVELTQRPQLAETKYNSFRALLDDLVVPSQPEYKPLDEAELKSNFHLDPDPKAKPPERTKREKPSRPAMKPLVQDSPDAKRARKSSVSYDSDIDDLARQNMAQSRLEQVLRETLDRLMRCKMNKNAFKGLGFPYDNPFAVRLERNGNVVPDEYFDIIVEPCDLSTVEDRIAMGYYKSFDMFKHDIDLISQNARQFYPPKMLMSRLTNTFEKAANAALAAARARLDRVG